MKLLRLLIPVLLLTACVEEPVTQTAYTPILMKRADLENSITVTGARKIKKAGKIYRKGTLLFINEKFEGVHVYNNADPANPIALGFITIPGNVDISIKNDIIYADNSVDLVSLRYTNNEIVELHRERNVFPEIVAPDMGSIPDEYLPENRPANTVIVNWEKP